MELWILIIGGVVLGIILFALSFRIVTHQTVGIVERFGGFKRAVRSGPTFIIPLVDRFAGRISLRLQEQTVPVDTKTKDDVMVKVSVGVQYVVSDAEKAFYKLTDKAQISTFVEDIVRGVVPKMPLDRLFEAKEEVGKAVKDALDSRMEEYGFDLQAVLVPELTPAQEVTEAMNQINASERLKVAAENKGEADKIKAIKAAEAEAESKRLQGEGIAKQREEIAKGLAGALETMSKGMGETEKREVMRILLMTQYFDTLKDVAAHTDSRVLMMQSDPSGLSNIEDQIMRGTLKANETAHQHHRGAEG